MLKTKVKHKILKILLFLFLIVFVFIVTFLIFYINSFKDSISSFERIDKEGSLYYCEYNENPGSNMGNLFPQLFAQFGCSAFITNNEYDEKLTCRNFDYYNEDENCNCAVINVACKYNPLDGYKSINMCNVAQFIKSGFLFKKGGLDKTLLPSFPLEYIPYFCTDGMNEKGLCCSILELDTKDGETAPYQNEDNKPTYSILQILRFVLDKCTTVQEAEEFIQTTNYKSILRTSYHLFVSDSLGDSTVIEWRNNQFTSTHSDVVTNFYTNSDDACDSYYKNGKLKEKYIEPISKYRHYHYGYGHGFNRFSKILESLDSHRSNSIDATKMTNKEVFNTLKDVSQEANSEDKTSNTLWSVIYNSTTLSLDIANDKDFDNIYTFSL